jgi:hypothetical protein
LDNTGGNTKSDQPRLPSENALGPPWKMAKIEGFVYLQRRSKGYAKRYLVLNGTDLYAYKSGDRDKLVFMHSLLSTVIEEPN